MYEDWCKGSSAGQLSITRLNVMRLSIKGLSTGGLNVGLQATGFSKSTRYPVAAKTLYYLSATR